MKKILILLPTILLLFSVSVSSQNINIVNVTSSSVVEELLYSGFNEFAAANNQEPQTSKEASPELDDLEAKRTGIIIGGVVLFLGAMFVVRRKIKKSINEKLN